MIKQYISDLYTSALYCLQNNDYTKAHKVISHCLALEPRNSEFIRINGICKFMEGDIISAKKFFINAIKLDTKNYLAYSNLANVYLEEKNYDLAFKNYSISIKINPKYSEGYNNIGNLYQQLSQYDNAIKQYNLSLIIDNKYAEAYNNRANAYKKLKKYNIALNDYIRALDLKPNYFEALYNLSYVYVQIGKIEMALEACNKCLKLNQNYLDAYLQKASIYKIINQPENALESYNQAISIKPNYAEALNNRGHLYLSQKNFEQGWQDYESRFLTNAYDSIILKSCKPLWNGSFDLSGPLYVWGEQGIGDQILHGSMLSNLNRIHQKKIISVEKKLISIFARSIPELNFIEIKEHLLEDEYATHIPIGSLGQYFRKSLEDFKEQKPYLIDDPILTSQIRSSPLFLNKKTCGISWNSINQRVGEDKSINLESMLAILQLPTINFINLQYGDVNGEIKKIEESSKIKINQMQGINLYDDIDGLASLIQACDIIVTCSNSTAHLAGALGKETLLLLPKHQGKFWYWHKNIDNKSLWYPSIRIYQQEEQGNWSKPVQEVKKYLEKKFE